MGSKELSLRTELEPPLSCWGCGLDWRSRWTAEDLAEVEIDNDPEKDIVCPDCHAELLISGQVKET